MMRDEQLLQLLEDMNRAGDVLDAFNDGAIYPCQTNDDVERELYRLERRYDTARSAVDTYRSAR